MELKDSSIYKCLTKGKKPVGKITGYALLGILIFFAVWSIVLAMFLTEASMIIGAVIGLAAVAIYAWFARKWVKKASKAIQKRLDKANAISPEEYERLEYELSQAEFMFRTFYFLSDYLYIPKARLLIKYLDIQKLQPTIHSTNGIQDSVWIDLTDEEDNKYRFYVKKWKDYLDYKYMFDDMLNAKRQEKWEQEQRR